LEKLGKNIIHLEIGEPDFETPERVKIKQFKLSRLGIPTMYLLLD
jgi:aspartate/methionine/tyrosine aminotransferase